MSKFSWTNPSDGPYRSSGRVLGLAVAAAVAVAVLVGAVSDAATWNGVRNEGARQESTLSAAYSDGALTLSNCVVKAEKAANVAGAYT